jgi:hypothetical protein
MSRQVLRVDAHGIPRPQPRPRVLKTGRVVSTTGPAAGWKRLVLAAIAEAMDGCDWQTIDDGPVALTLVTRLPTKALVEAGRDRRQGRRRQSGEAVDGRDDAAAGLAR